MAARTNHWKLGLFILVGGALGVATAGALGAHSLHPAVDRYVSYFDESVLGLEVGSAIKFRGVTIGEVGKIDVAPDHRHVEVTSDLDRTLLRRLGLEVAGVGAAPAGPRGLESDVGLRAQLVSAGLTGVKFLQLDFFTVADHPPPELPFPVPSNYIPATPSMLKDLEDTLQRTLTALPEVSDQVKQLVGRVDLLVRQLDEGQLSAQVLAAVGSTRRLLEDAQRKVAQVDAARISAQVQQTLAGLRETETRVNELLARVGGDRGLLQSVQRASDAVGDAARDADGLGNQLDGTLRSLDDAARSIHRLAGALERDPDMLVKGRSAEKPR